MSPRVVVLSPGTGCGGIGAGWVKGVALGVGLPSSIS